MHIEHFQAVLGIFIPSEIWNEREKVKKELDLVMTVNLHLIIEVKGKQTVIIIYKYVANIPIWLQAID